jgi:plastocyanin
MRWALVVLMLCLSPLALIACGDDDDSDTTAVETETTTTEETQPETNAPAPSGEAVRSAKVEMQDFSFEPPTVTIQAGGKVTWQNEGETAHTATADDDAFDTGRVDPGKLKFRGRRLQGARQLLLSLRDTPADDGHGRSSPVGPGSAEPLEVVAAALLAGLEPPLQQGEEDDQDREEGDHGEAEEGDRLVPDSAGEALAIGRHRRRRHGQQRQ